MIRNYIKIAWRNMLAHKATSFINLFGLTIGMTAAFLIFMWVKNEFSFDTYYPQATSIYRLTTFSANGDEKTDERTPHVLGETVKAQIPDVKLLTRIYPLTIFSPTVKAGQNVFKDKTAAYIDANWFAMFPADFVKGSAENFQGSPNGVVISVRNAKKYFGDEDALGKTLTVNGTNCTVLGVIKNFPANSSFRYDLYISSALRPVRPAMRLTYNWANSYHTFVKLTPDSKLAVANQINRVIDTTWNNNYSVGLVALSDIHFENDLKLSVLKHGDKKTTNILLFLGILLLVIACVNYVNLTTAKSLLRIKEVSVKKIIGAERWQLYTQFTIESALISLLALMATFVLVFVSLPWFNAFTDNHFILSLDDPSLWMLLAATFVCTLILNSIYPALLLSSFKPAVALRSNNADYTKGGFLRRTLVVMQFAVSITLVVVTLVIYKQISFVDKQYKNYDRAQLFSFRFPSTLQDDAKKLQMEGVLQQLQAQSSIQSAAVSSSTDVINVENVWGGFNWEGRDADINYDITFMPAGNNFNKVLNLQVVQGRWFIPGNANDEHNFVINQEAVKQLALKQPVIGQRFSLDNDTGKIVGVVNNFHYLDLHKKIGAVVLGNNSLYNNSFLVKSQPGAETAALTAAGTIWRKYFPDEPFDYHFASDEFNTIYNAEQKASQLVWIFSVLAILISCLGLYGLASFSAVQRNKEIGIRKVLGASVTGIVRLISLDFIRLVFISIFIALPIGWLAADKWLQDFVYRINIEWWVLALTAIGALVIAFATIGAQAIKAAIANPVKSLRSE
nr:ABC transporter permease [uncultured Mucilaginibacter sp.]